MGFPRPAGGRHTRRLPALRLPRVSWRQADVCKADLSELFAGADAVVHLAWLIQPSRDEAVTERTNVYGSSRVMQAVAQARVPALVYASSVGAYAPGPSDFAVDEAWPATGVRSSFYARHKAAVERLLDEFQERHSEVRVVRLRPGLCFKAGAASGIRRLFVGPLLQPSSPDWLDMGLQTPVMDTSRAREELGWTPRARADEALIELLDGLCRGDELSTPPLAKGTSGALRAGELRTGVGGTDRV